MEFATLLLVVKRVWTCVNYSLLIPIKISSVVWITIITIFWAHNKLGFFSGGGGGSSWGCVKQGPAETTSFWRNWMAGSGFAFIVDGEKQAY